MTKQYTEGSKVSEYWADKDQALLDLIMNGGPAPTDVSELSPTDYEAYSTHLIQWLAADVIPAPVAAEALSRIEKAERAGKELPQWSLLLIQALDERHQAHLSATGPWQNPSSARPQ